MTSQQLSNAITDKTKLIILNSPSNPTGQVYSKKELTALGEVLLAHPKVLILTDDIYEHIYWGDEPLAHLAALFPALKDRLILINGVSKGYAMTGWRIGFAAAHRDIITAMRKIQSQSTSNPCSISQAAAVAAFNGPQDCLKTMNEAFKERHDFVIHALNDIKGITCIPGDGAFYAFADVTALIAANENCHNDVELATWLLETAGVAVVPGTPFGASGYVRISFATSMDVLENAMARIKQAVQE